ncbi:unnamed protein product [Paramecium sonneborni]|uniref:Mitochondrial import inner membrane translocase subunit TIM50 n=1 Tax=Paramecium sonneborni TaxID=65129 RepID=A0A8S1R1Q6_9CILI|nr:unnamed protein product [Paramecium sonneborni]
MIGQILAWLCQLIDKLITHINKKIMPKKKLELRRYHQIPRSISFRTEKLRLLIGLEGTLVCTSPIFISGWDWFNVKYPSGATQDFYVKHRPYLDIFLLSVSKYYDVSIYTTKIQEFAVPIINRFCIQFEHNFYRQKQILFFTQSCVQSRHKIRKEINMTTSNPHNVIFVDYDEDQCQANLENAYTITQYKGQDDDIELKNLEDFLIRAKDKMQKHREEGHSVSIQDVLEEM